MLMIHTAAVVVGECQTIQNGILLFVAHLQCMCCRTVEVRTVVQAKNAEFETLFAI